MSAVGIITRIKTESGCLGYIMEGGIASPGMTGQEAQPEVCMNPTTLLRKVFKAF
jgi:hypothetical protein